MNIQPQSILEDTSYIDGITEMLRDLLRQVIKQREPSVLAILEEAEMASGIPEHLVEHALQVIGIWLQLMNIAEENASMRNRREIERQGGPDEVIGSFSHALGQAAALGIEPETVGSVLEALDVGPTITAHPTEAKRVTVLEIHRRIYLKLYELESPRWTPRERQALVASLKNEIDLLWLTGEVRLEKPTVEGEVGWGLHFFRETLFERTPALCEHLRSALHRHYPELRHDVRPPLSYASWIGGDRDGNPFVTVEVTRNALAQNRIAAVERICKSLKELSHLISLSSFEISPTKAFKEALERQLELSGRREAIMRRNPNEPFRQFFSALLARSEAMIGECTARPFASVAELESLLREAERALAEMNTAGLAGQYVRPVRWEVQIFGFRTASLDLRQNSTVVNRVLGEVWRKLNPLAAGDAPVPGSTAWTDWLLAELEKPMGFLPRFQNMSGETGELLGLFDLVRETLDGPDHAAVGAFILSMTQGAEDILGVYLLAKLCGLFSDPTAREICRLRIVPLFETIEDLRAAPAIMRDLLARPMVRSSIAVQGGAQEIMLGYSDSNKDGGFFCASFELFEAQRGLVAIGREAGVAVRFFHGRGGSVSRGGAPTGRAIAAQPVGTVGGRMRVTEQGEVVSLKFANRGTALNNLEVLTSSVLLHTLKSAREPEQKLVPEHQQAVEEIARLSYRAYRKLAEDPALLDYFQAASPVEELALLKIGSRPSRRFGAKGIADLRAIPWVFAWSQNRHLLTGWYGLGYALDDFLSARGGEGLKLLREMFLKSPGFRLAVDEVEKSLYLADMAVAELYASLVHDRVGAERLYALIRHEHKRTAKVMQELAGSKMLCERFQGFRRRFDRVRPMVDQANRWQVQLLRETREKKAKEALHMPLLATMNCVAAGLGWTG